MAPKTRTSSELRKEAVSRYRELQPLSTMELDSLIRWSNEKILKKTPPGEVTMLVIRLLLAGRADSALSSPQEGHAEARLREKVASTQRR